MAKFRGHGGFWVLVNPGPVGTIIPTRPPVIVHNAIYEVVTRAELAQSRTPNCGGFTEGLPKYRHVESAMLRVAEDDLLAPQMLGLTEGAELPYIGLKRGELNQFDALVRAVVENVHVVNDQKKARWVVVTLKHGQYLRGVPAPVNLDGSAVAAGTSGGFGFGYGDPPDEGGGGDF